MSRTVAKPKNKARMVTDSLTVGLATMAVLTIVQRLVGLGRQVAICRLLDPEALGRWNLSYSMIMLVAPLLVLGIPGTYGRYTEHFRQQGRLRSFFKRTSRLTLFLTIAGVSFVIFAAESVAWLFFNDSRCAGLIRVSALTLACVISFNFFIEALTSLRQVRAVSWLRFICGLLFTAVSLLFLVCWKSTAVSIVAGYGVACGISALLGGYFYWFSVRKTDEDTLPTSGSALWSKLLPFAGWLWLSDLLSNLFEAVDRYMIVHICDSSAAAAAATVGQYHSSRLIPEQMIAVATMSAAMLLPYLSNHWERNERETAHQRLNLSLKIYALLMSVGGAALLLVAPWLFEHVLGGKYAEGLSVTPWSIIACIWYGLNTFVQLYLFCCERAKFASLALAVGLIANIALNLLLLPILGLQGAVLATAISNGLSLLVICEFSRQFGMRWSRGLLLTAMAPLCLAHHPGLGLMALIGITLLAYRMDLLFDDNEQALLRQFSTTVTEKFRSHTKHLEAWIGRFTKPNWEST